MALLDASIFAHFLATSSQLGYTKGFIAMHTTMSSVTTDAENKAILEILSTYFTFFSSNQAAFRIPFAPEQLNNFSLTSIREPSVYNRLS